eukprot:m.291120 g.291120  ORF g.291120 m.291120 type:complete len:544 (+) comp12413_c0_seq1:60-1691(+)
MCRMQGLCVGLVLAVAILGVVPIEAKPPSVLFVLVDDLGWADVGFHRAQGDPEVVTPNIDALARAGLQLERHYVHQFCTPTRTSVQSGRLPVHVNTGLGSPCNDNTGIAYNMTGIAEKLKLAKYSTHFVGKWDAGMATPRHTPHGRGYDTSLHYFSHKNDFWSQANMQTCCEDNQQIIDLWRTDRGASDVNGTDYEEYLFEREMLNIIHNHNTSQPLFLFYTPHVAHCPLQVPRTVFDRFDFMTDDEGKCEAQTDPTLHPIDPHSPDTPYKCRQQVHAMINVLDDVIGSVTSALQSRGLWDDLLIIFSSDNGGPVDLQENAANNWPLRGGKYSLFEGGIRATAFVSGGFLPRHMQGQKATKPVHIADWYATLCRLAGVDPTDHRAADAGLPPIDSLDLWDYISGANASSPRSVIPFGGDCIIRDQWKLITHPTMPDFWQGPKYPNSSSALLNEAWLRAGNPCTNGCLFDVENDPTEQNNLITQQPDIATQLSNLLDAEKKSYFHNHDHFENNCPSGVKDCACYIATTRYGGFLGPYALLDHRD